MRLATKLTIVFILLSIIPMAAIGYISFLNGERTIESQTFRHLIATNNLRHREFERWIADNKRQLRTLAQRPLLRENVALLVGSDFALNPGEPIQDPAIHSAYTQLIEDHLRIIAEEPGGVEELSVIRATDGLIIASTDPSKEGLYRESETYFLRGKTVTYVDKVTYWPSLGSTAMHISTPISTPRGRTIAVLEGHADLAEMSDIISSFNELSQSEDTYLVNGSNFFVTEPRFGEGYALKKALYSSGVETCLAGSNGTGAYQDYRGVAVLGAYRWIPSLDLCILTEVDQSEAFAPIQALQRTIIGFGTAIAVLVTFLGVLFGQSLTRPLRQLERAARAIGEGDLDQTIDVHTPDEIGELANSFNEMVARLTASNEMVEHSLYLMRSLETAGQRLQRVHDEGEVYRTIAQEITALGYELVLMRMTSDGQHLKLSHITIAPHLLQEAERLAGLSIEGIREPLDSEGLIGRVMRSRDPLFIEDMGEALAETLGGLSAKTDDKIIALFGLPTAIYVPLHTDAAVFGLMVVLGSDLAEHDVPAIGTFAGQVSNALENARLYQELRAWGRELEERVDERTELLRRSNAELEQFAYVASHDLQEPLRSISGFLQLIERRYHQDEGREFIDRAVGAAQRMQALIEDLLEFSRVGTRAGDLAPVPAAKCVEAALYSLHQAIEDSGAKLTIQDDLPTVLADEAQLTRLFQNLIANAIKFRSERPPQICVAAHKEDGPWRFEVRDNGIGIKQEYHQRIFQVFQRLHSREDYSGTGIGLAIVKKIVERHGGQVWVDSEPGKGSTFYFTLEDGRA
ncbi:MAG: ATP-binding protein [Anaerolineales bacterium]|nr:ATP-binding protein [Anaerolineales bacterium]